MLRIYLSAMVFLTALIIAPQPVAIQTAPAVGELTQQELDNLRQIMEDLRTAREIVARAEANMIDFWLDRDQTAAGKTTTRLQIPPLVEVELPSPPGPEPVEDLFASVPFAVPALPAYTIPTIDDCDWIVKDGMFSSMHGLLPEYSVRAAFVASMDAGDDVVTFGVWDNIPRAVVGGLYNINADHSVIWAEPDTGTWSQDLRVEFVGLDDSCEMGLGWSSNWGFPGYIGVYNIGIRGQQESFIILANDGIGKLIMDGCWWLPSITYTGNQMHASGMHIDKWETLIWRRHQFRGVLPTDTGTLIREHSGYFKSCVGDPANDGGTWIVQNNLLGGNRSGFQIRPQADKNPQPMGPIVIGYNYAHGYGWAHGSSPETFDGGACITSWVGPESDVYVVGNQITDAKYACMVLSGQPAYKNWLNEDGFPIKSLNLWGNTFENKQGDRICTSISAVGEVTIWPDNTWDSAINGDLMLDSPWNFSQNGIMNGPLQLTSQGVADQLKGMVIKTQDPANPGNLSKVKAFDTSLLDSLVISAPPSSK